MKLVSESYYAFLQKKSNEASQQFMYRTTNWKWLLDLLKTGKIVRKERFISFSNDPDSYKSTNDYGGTNIIFNRSELEKQGLIDIEYDVNFFNTNPELCMYVLGYKDEEDYYDNLGYEDYDDLIASGDLEMTFDEYIGDFEEEDESVLKNLKFTDNLIVSVEFETDRPNKELLKLLDIYNITYTI